MGIMLAILLFCLVLTFCQYKQVSQQYEQVRNFEPSPNSIVVEKGGNIQNSAANGEEAEERPQKRAGASRPDMVKKLSTVMEAQTIEEELGELDVDFA